MSSPYFPTPPTGLSAAEQQGWRRRQQEAEVIVGIAETGIPQVSQETLFYWQRYVQGELTLEQLLLLQCQRLRVR